VADPCELIQCVRGQVCAPQRAACLPDPCLAIACAAGSTCVVLGDGRGECVDPSRLPGVQRVLVSAAGSGCGCRMGGAPGQEPGISLLPLGLLAVVCLRSRARRRR
jgi:MYXO-CTERM domain-containing protein